MRPGNDRAVPRSLAFRAFVGALIVLIALALAWAVSQLPATGGLAPVVAGQLEQSGVTHPVTAVLLNFRAYDTLLEIAVLVLAVIGTYTIGSQADRASAPPLDAQVRRLVAWLIPIMIVTAGYLLWRGSHAPGGAFQAGAVLAAGLVLLFLSGVRERPSAIGWSLRAWPLLGFTTFLLVGAGGLLWHTHFLALPPRIAGALILLIETTLAVSIGVILGLLFAGSPRRAPPDDRGGNP